MKWFPFTLVYLLTCMMLIPTISTAGPREGGKTGKTLVIKLKYAYRFGDVIVKRGRYKVKAKKCCLTLLSPTSMVTKAQLSVVETKLPQPVGQATVFVKQNEEGVEIILRHLERKMVATGVRCSKDELVRKSVTLVSRETKIEGADAAEFTDKDAIDQALTRYLKSVSHCADMAHRNRWKSDDPRFQKCVCPMTSRWRMPKVKADRRVHPFLAKGKSGFSITVTPEGRVKDCKVWLGAKAPTDVAVPAKSDSVPGEAKEKATQESTP